PAIAEQAKWRAAPKTSNKAAFILYSTMFSNTNNFENHIYQWHVAIGFIFISHSHDGSTAG
ncbi:MAG: hypothetical protein ACI4QS_07425, partial [Comamonas sp.]